MSEQGFSSKTLLDAKILKFVIFHVTKSCSSLIFSPTKCKNHFVGCNGMQQFVKSVLIVDSDRYQTRLNSYKLQLVQTCSLYLASQVAQW